MCELSVELSFVAHVITWLVCLLQQLTKRFSKHSFVIGPVAFTTWVGTTAFL